MIEVELAAVQIDQRSATPVMLLKESQPPGRTLAVYIGRTEAQAIVDSVQGIEPPRPMTHDLMRDVVEALGAIVVKVVITELVDATFYAQVELKIQQKVVVVSARPSDAVALAVRVAAPMFVASEVMALEGFVVSLESDDPASAEDENPEKLVVEFRDFLEHINPEDFS
ncbi:MAG: bifunctional nuclease family protein [Acidimicrobiaceae bacterium]|nr:bifunctional nuclease family protein [Acidimicrobiaceae bacterium]